MKNYRQLSCIGLIFGLAGLSFMLAWALMRFSTPKPKMVYVGKVEDFQAGQPPRFFSEYQESFYVLNIDGELIALVAHSDHHIVRCTVNWAKYLERFVDPCLGTNFTIRGEYAGKGPPGKLNELPIQVLDGQVSVDLGYQ